MRFDNCPEFIANAVADWYRFSSVGICFIDLGSTWLNAWIGSLNGRLRIKFLNGDPAIAHHLGIPQSLGVFVGKVLPAAPPTRPGV